VLRRKGVGFGGSYYKSGELIFFPSIRSLKQGVFLDRSDDWPSQSMFASGGANHTLPNSGRLAGKEIYRDDSCSR
jgi:hypothetical protein